MHWDEATTIGEKVREARKRLGWTQCALATRAGFHGCQTISDIEHGCREPTVAESSRLAHALFLDLGDLVRPAPLKAWPLVLWCHPGENHAVG